MADAAETASSSAPSVQPGAADVAPPAHHGAPSAIQAESTEAVSGSAPMPSAAPAVPQTERERLQDAVRREPRVADHWMALLEDVKDDGIEAVRDVYDRFFTYFPNAASHWIAYAEMELAHSNFGRVDAIFVRCLRTTLSVDLWQFYLQYTRRVNPLPPFTGEDNSPREQTRRVLEEAYEFALKHIGWDRESGMVWHDYLNLIREREARGSWQEGQKMDALRRVFRRAVVIPLNNVESIWREYDAYETALNKLTAKKFLAESSPGYMQARSVLRELKHHTENLARPDLPHLPCWVMQVPGARPPAKERQTLQAWRRYLEWEEKNPLMLEDAVALQSRVLSAYRKAVMYMRFDAVLWYNAASFCQSVHREADALAWYRAGIDACPWSLLLRFGYAELCRAQGRYMDGTASLDDLVVYLQRELDLRLDALHQAQARVDEETAAERRRIQGLRKQLTAEDDEGDAAVELADSERRLHEDADARKGRLAEESGVDIDEWKSCMAQTWIQYMHFVRRAEGIRPTRQVFGRARRSAHCTWPVYEANALLEYHCSKEPVVATKVFELALRTFGTDEQLVVRYLDFLISINDDTNARAVFERTVSSLPPERARSIFARWAEYEYCYGDMSAISRLETRMQDLYPDESKVEAAADRLRFRTLDAVRMRDLGYSRAATRRKERAETPAVDETKAETPPAAQAAPAPSAPPAKSAGGRQTMEDIRKSLVANAEPLKKEDKRASSKEPPAKKAKHTAAEAPRRARTEPTPPPQPSLPEPLLYFLSLLPPAQVFDGPQIPPERILECIMHTSLPTVQLPGYDRKAPRRATAVWYKYPNPHTEHVQSIDVLDRTICPQTGTVRTERLISVEQHTPRWIKRILGVDGATYVREVITFDPHEPAVYLDSTNLSFSQYLLVKEDVAYRPSTAAG
ncbi:mRNA 3'-end-processing protein rna14 [Malassezia brasiliensis]|uniref:mRNA 3'-end-processing protein RNA14 n=1 Tax=Malassezia brasiliensis TaxID=1821822 RepID=A0AAF0INS3_9BASI|nr:mRNA 3'-end-processing protein rna14 [Malassezia brasiliensis]